MQLRAASVESAFAWLRAIGEPERWVRKRSVSLVGIISGGFVEECPAKVAPQECLQERAIRVLYSVPRQECPHNCLTHVKQECQTKSVTQECPTSVFYKSVPQWCTVLQERPC